MKHLLQSILGKVKYVSTTTDIWSAYRRSFLGVTCHWISVDFTRCSAALACSRFEGSHTFKSIGEKLSETNQSYSLSLDKNTITVTDSAANFVKAFKEFGYNCILTDNDTGEMISDSDVIEFENIQEILENPEQDGDKYIILPRYHKCACHLLALIPTSKFIN